MGGIKMPNQRNLPDMEQVYNTYFSAVYNYVYYRLLHKADTEDVVSEVFMKVCRNLQRYDSEKASLKTWIFRITDNALTDFYRRRKPAVSFNQDETGLENVLHIHFDTQYEQECEPTRRAVLDALRQLPERDRIFVYYRYFLGVSNREIARRSGVNENTVSTVLSRARGKLKTILRDEI